MIRTLFWRFVFNQGMFLAMCQRRLKRNDCYMRREFKSVSENANSPCSSRGNEALIVLETVPSRRDQSLVTSAATIFQLMVKVLVFLCSLFLALEAGAAATNSADE